MGKPHTDIWQFHDSLARRLMQWAGLSVGAGTALLLPRDAYFRGLGGQFIAWGAIDAALAFFGVRRSRRKSTELASHDPENQAQERAKLRRLLFVNFGLDIGYVLGGITLARTKGKENRFWRGSGSGIVIQGGFLLFFDLVHALQLKDPS